MKDQLNDKDPCEICGDGGHTEFYCNNGRPNHINIKSKE